MSIFRNVRLTVAFLGRFCKVIFYILFSVSQENLVAKTSMGRRSGPILDLKSIAKPKRSLNDALCRLCEGVCAIAEEVPYIMIGWYLNCLICTTQENACNHN